MEEDLPLLIVEPHREMRTLLEHFFVRQQVAAYAFLVKPFSLTRLGTVMRRALQDNRGQ